jgi:septal ring factor EnvC (AmiA/AmiB activator)
MLKGRPQGIRKCSKSFRLSEEAITILERASNQSEFLDNLIKTSPLALENEIKLVELTQEIDERELVLNSLKAKRTALKESLDKADKRIDESVKRKQILDTEWDSSLGAMVKRVGLQKFRAEFLSYNSKRIGIPSKELMQYIEERFNGNEGINK